MCSCHSIQECCVMFSGVKLSMGSFVLFMILILVNGTKPKLITLNISLLPFMMEPWLATMLLFINLSHELLVSTKSSLF